MSESKTDGITTEEMPDPRLVTRIANLERVMRRLLSRELCGACGGGARMRGGGGEQFNCYVCDERAELLSMLEDPDYGRDQQADEAWASAHAHFEAVMQQYLDLPARSGGPALAMTFYPLKRRYDKGDRTEYLRRAMLAVE